MNILLTNDDGIYAKGLWALYHTLSRRHKVVVVAPDRERSAVGHGITIHQPLRFEKISVSEGHSGYALNGTPADCIKLGILEIFDKKPDMVISGINPGANVGININYSGTVAAAREAALYGVAAIAASKEGLDHRHYEEMADFIEKLTEKLINAPLSPGTFLNVNFPDIPFRKSRGVLVNRHGTDILDEYFEVRTDTRERQYYWHGCHTKNNFEHDDVDNTAISEKYISITPIKCDVTDYNAINELKKWGITV